jgi:integrase
MSVSALSNGRLRVQVYDPATRRMVSAAGVMGLPRDRATFPNTKRGRKDAQALERAAEDKIAARKDGPTVAEWRERWLTDPVFTGNWKEGADGPTAAVNRQRTKSFVERYGHLPVGLLDADEQGDVIVAEWLAGGRNIVTIMSLRAMCNVATGSLAGRLIRTNPFANLGLGADERRSRPRRQPPSIEQLEGMVAAAWEIAPPSFAAYLEFAAVVGIRPGELDALQPAHLDFAEGVVHVVTQWNRKVGRFTTPKYGPYDAALSDRAVDVLRRMAVAGAGEGRFVFNTASGNHYTPSTRSHHWNRVRCSVGLADRDLYACTRHYFGWFALNVLDLEPRVIADQFGHKDGGKLVIQTYGHPEARRSHAKIRNAFNGYGQVRPLRRTA